MRPGSGTAHLGIRCDISSVEGVQRMFAQVVNEFGTVDIQVNNAVLVPTEPADAERRTNFYNCVTTLMVRQSIGITASVTDDDWLRWLGVIIPSVFWCTCEALKIVEPRKYCKIINIASNGGTSALSAHSPGFGPSKGAVISLKKTVALDVAGANIYVNCIALWGIRTADFDLYLEKIGTERRSSFFQLVPLGRLCEGSEYAALAVHLASDEDYCLGQFISANGVLMLKESASLLPAFRTKGDGRRNL